jgi:NAD+ kinase
MRNINKVKIFANDNDLSKSTKEKLVGLLTNNHFQMVDDNPDLAIAIGGDGAFLRMIKASKFNENTLYVGINTGTLGFLQEVKVDDLELFIETLNNNQYKIDKIGIQETTIITDETKYHFNSLNEIVVREKELNTVIMQVFIDGACIERYIGDGLLISTSIGSTAYNLSFGGSIVYNNLHTLQITPIAPLNNQVYRNLLNSIIIPEHTEILMKPLKKDLLVSIDGENIAMDDVKEIRTAVKNSKLQFLRLETYNFYEKINEKFLTNKKD